MTIASNNGSTSSNTLSTDSMKLLETADKILPNITTRPDRNSSNGQESNVSIPSEVGQEEMMEAVRTMLLGIGENPEREGLLKTPKRVAEAMRFLTSGYSQSLEELLNGAIFD